MGVRRASRWQSTTRVTIDCRGCAGATRRAHGSPAARHVDLVGSPFAAPSGDAGLNTPANHTGSKQQSKTSKGNHHRHGNDQEQLSLALPLTSRRKPV